MLIDIASERTAELTMVPAVPSVQDKIAGYALQTPNHIAASDGTRQFTYSSFDTQARQIAAGLRTFGVTSDVLVAVLAGRSVDLILTIAAVLYSGGGYLPIDPDTPVERIRFMLRDSAPRVLITERRFGSALEDIPAGIQVVFLDDFAGGQFSEATAGPVTGGESSLAYVIYTSGSTGSPKGVEVTHRGLSHFCSHMQSELSFGPGDTMLAVASASFDVAVFELLFPLYCGGRVVILPRTAAADGKELGAAIARYNASVVLATPATWKLLLDSGWEGHANLRAVSGGEAMSPSLARAICAKTRALWNHYGPTEATIAATSWLVKGDEDKLPIGRPVAGLHLHVLGEDGAPVSTGSAGELYISGPGLARGYRGDPRRTAERFLPLPGHPGTRVYRTGDLVRELPDGAFDFIARVDNQVKIRGHRVELEEIESALVRHPAVQEAAIITHDRAADDRRLVAFIVAKEGYAPSVADLRAFLATTLYSFMIPGNYFVLPALPRNANGKIDRHALRLLGAGEHAVRTPPGPSGDPVQMELLDIWRRIPGFQAIGVTDSFFDFGGHSLLAARLMNDIEERFGVRLPLATLFEAPTVEALAKFIRAGNSARPWSPLVTIRSSGTRPPLFCVHGIGGNALNFERLGVWLSPDQPLYGLQAYGVDCGRPIARLEDMASAYIAAIHEIQPEGPYFIAGYSAGGIVAFEMVRQLRRAGKSVALLVLFDALVYGHATPRASSRTFTERAARTVAGIAARIAVFFRMRGTQRTESFKRNWTYYWWLLAITMRTNLYLTATRLGLPLGPPRRMQDAFALAVRRYQPDAVDTPAVLYKAARGDSDEDSDPSMGWDPLVSELTVETCDADHLGMFYEPQVKALAGSLDRYLRAAQPDDSLSAEPDPFPSAYKTEIGGR